MDRKIDWSNVIRLIFIVIIFLRKNVREIKG